MKKLTLLIISFFGISFLSAQVGIATDQPKATLEVAAQAENMSMIDGIIPPRLKGDQLQAKDALYTMDQNGAIVYITEAVSLPTPKTQKITTQGFYFFDGNIWQRIVFGLVDSTEDAWVNNAADNRLELSTKSDGETARNTSEQVIITDEGKLAVGTLNPMAKMDIHSPVIKEGFRLVDGSEADNKFLMSDASGRAFWDYVSLNKVIGNLPDTNIDDNTFDIRNYPSPNWMNTHANITLSTGNWEVSVNLLMETRSEHLTDLDWFFVKIAWTDEAGSTTILPNCIDDASAEMCFTTKNRFASGNFNGPTLTSQDVYQRFFPLSGSVIITNRSNNPKQIYMLVGNILFSESLKSLTELPVGTEEGDGYKLKRFATSAHAENNITAIEVQKNYQQ